MKYRSLRQVNVIRTLTRFPQVTEKHLKIKPLRLLETIRIKIARNYYSWAIKKAACLKIGIKLAKATFKI